MATTVVCKMLSIWRHVFFNSVLLWGKGTVKVLWAPKWWLIQNKCLAPWKKRSRFIRDISKSQKIINTQISKSQMCNIICFLVGGFNPFKQNMSQIGFIFPRDRGENKKYLKPPPWWFIMENLIKMDDLGVPLFLETPIYKYDMFHIEKDSNEFWNPPPNPFGFTKNGTFTAGYSCALMEVKHG